MAKTGAARRSQFNFRLKPEDEKLLHQMADKLDMTVAGVVRLALERLWSDIRAGKLARPGLSFRQR